MMVNWEILKQSAIDRSLSIQYIDLQNKYWLKIFDGPFFLETIIDKNLEVDNIVDFETNFKPNGNKSPKTQVTTEFEQTDKILKLCCGSNTVDNDSIATILIKIPGTPGTGDGRYLSSGTAFFDTHNSGDRILSVSITDEDNILQNGAGFEVGSYTEMDAPSNNQGSFLLPNGLITAITIGGYGFVPSGFYIKIVGKKTNNITTGTLFANLEWGK